MIPSPIPRSRSDHTLRRDDPRNNSPSAETESNALRGIAGSTSNLTSSPSQSRRTDSNYNNNTSSNIPRTAGSERSLVDTDPIAAIRALRSRLRQESSSHTLEMTALETSLAQERERKRAEREAARQLPSTPTPSAMLMLRRANTSTTTTPTGIATAFSTTPGSTTSPSYFAAVLDSPADKAATMTLYDEQLRKLRQWQNDSKERVRQRETERDAEREKFRALRRGGDTRLKRRSMNTKRAAAHKFVLQSAEFYGADFSAPPVADPEIVALTTAGLNDTQLIEQEQTRATQGSVFITALTKLATSRSRLDLEGEAGTDGVEAAADDETHRSPLIVPLGVPAVDVPPPPPVAPPSAKKLTDAIRESMPAIDYSDVFPADIGHRAGVTVFRIEGLKPVLQPSSRRGRFCIADCYIVLHSVPRHDAASSNRDKSASNSAGRDLDDDDETIMSHRIYVYIGAKAEIDKRFCAAMFSTGLRNWIYATRTVERETSGDESPDFLALFGTKFVLDKNIDAAADTSLFVAEEKRWPCRMYMLCGNKEIKLRLVCPNARSLDSANVFLLDWGNQLYQWNGAQSSLQQKAKCRILTSRINRHERVGKATTFEIEEGSETPEFRNMLGGARAVRSPSKPQDDKSDSEAHTSDDSDAEVDRRAREVDTFAQQQADDARFAVIGDAPVVLYRAFEDLSDEVDTHIVKVGKLARAMLVSDAAYVLDAGVELFLWIGKNAPLDLRQMATELLARIAPLQKRPKWVGLHKLMEGHESEVFKLRFPDWDTTSQEVNWEEVKSVSIDPSRSIGAGVGMRVDVRALYAPPVPHDAATTAGVEATLQHANGLLQQFSAFVYTKGRFVQLPAAEKGHFFSDDAYVFLCVYRLEEERERARREAKELKRRRTRNSVGRSAGDPGDDRSSAASSERGTASDGEDASERGDDERGVECVVYFWQGRLASRLAYSTFKFKTQSEMEALVKHMYGCEVRVAFLEQGKEPIALLAHMGNAIVVHRGRRSDWFAKVGKPDVVPRMFHIRTDVRYKTTRAVEVPVRWGNLVSRDCFYIHAPCEGENSYLWRGRGASKEELRKAEAIIGRILAVVGRGHEVTLPPTPTPSDHLTLTTHILAIQGAEPSDLVGMLLPPSLRLRPPKIHTGTEYYYVPPPRFLRCSCSAGYFAVEEVVHWAQADLHPEVCVILDPGAPRTLWVWVGREASDVVRKLCRKSVEVWLQRLDDGRGGSGVPPVFGDGSTAVWTPPPGTANTPPTASDDNLAAVSSQHGNSRALQPRARAETAARRAVMAGFKARKRASSGLTVDVDDLNHLLGNGQSPASSSSQRPLDEDDPDAIPDVAWILQGCELPSFTSYFIGWDERPEPGSVTIGNAFTTAAGHERAAKQAAKRRASGARPATSR
ncbi:hypothetical protein HDU86_008325 [Geranomyces michiganensis]|nr:hypothetical protein HDU86_008325 [Geranomyces michiganensis]